MSFSNEFLYDFKPVYEGILMAKDVKPERAIVEVIDEEQEGAGMFEPAGALEVLEQIGDDVNTLTIYTDRAAYFWEFVETMYEKNGLVSLIVSKKHLGLAKKTVGCSSIFLFDFEWDGAFYEKQIALGKHYIPIHKRAWRTAENLDIAVPIGYNTVIVKSMHHQREKLGRDRLKKLFMKIELIKITKKGRE